MILKLPAVTISAFGRKVEGDLTRRVGGFNRGDGNPLDGETRVWKKLVAERDLEMNSLPEHA